MDHPQPRSVVRHRVERRSRVVGGAVVDDDHLDVGYQRRQCRVDVVDEAADGFCVVVAREHGRDAVDDRHSASPASVAQTQSISASVISGKHGTLMHSAAQASASGQSACSRCAIGRLLGDGQWVVDRAGHAGGFELGPGAGAVCAAKHSEMVGVVGVGGLPTKVGSRCPVAIDDCPAPLDIVAELRQRQPQPCRFDLRHPEVLGDVLVHVLRCHAVNAKDAHSLGEVGIVGDDCSAVADATEVLGGVEAVCRNDRAARVSKRAVGLGGVFDHHQVGHG